MANRELLASLQSEISAIENGTAHAKRSKQSKVRQTKPASSATEEASTAATECNDAFKKIVALANVQERSSRQLGERLSRDGFSESAIDDALSRAKRCGIVDDLRFADLLIRSRISQGKGSSGIEAELKRNGINPDEVDGWPYDYATSYEDDFNRAIALLKSKPPRAKNKREAAYRKLVQRGFNSTVASDAARAWYETQTSDI